MVALMSPESWLGWTRINLLENLDSDGIATAFKKLTGENIGDVLAALGKQSGAGVALLHHAIVLANEIGQPVGQPLRDPPITPPGVSDDVSEPPRKVQRIACQATVADPVQKAKAKVRSLALHEEPNESLMLLYLEDLAAAATSVSHKDMELFDDLYRQARRYQGKVDMANVILTVLGGGTGELITKAISKSLKKVVEPKPIETVKPEESPNPSPSIQHRSPLTDLYSQVAAVASLQQMMNPLFDSYRGGASRGARRGRGRGTDSSPPNNYQCYFCNSPDHFYRDCDKMKEASKMAKTKWRVGGVFCRASICRA
ncbi:uncharacterized protein LOC135498872 isoform X1 [Lineus longissimus]|uniref:uncharacterized protein LOC135498872 isoform X1 n=1 Tax=Lineus longissimus TaxID=88925 RepID=UPI00315C6944